MHRLLRRLPAVPGAATKCGCRGGHTGAAVAVGLASAAALAQVHHSAAAAAPAGAPAAAGPSSAERDERRPRVPRVPAAGVSAGGQRSSLLGMLSPLAVGGPAGGGGGEAATPVPPVPRPSEAIDAEREFLRYELAMREAQETQSQPDFDAAIRHLSTAAHAGSAAAQYSLASMLTRPGPQQDFGHAHDFLMMASRQGHTRAQFALGNFYYRGQGGAQDLTQAAHWFELAAAGPDGMKEAQYMLGQMYFDSDGVQQNEAQAVRYLTAAAERGYPRAMNNLAIIHLSGAGDEVPKDGVLAVRWWTAASNAGYAEASFNLAVLYGRGDPAVGVAADELASRRLMKRCLELADPDKEAQLCSDAASALAELDDMAESVSTKRTAQIVKQEAETARAEEEKRQQAMSSLKERFHVPELSGAKAVAAIAVAGGVSGFALGGFIAVVGAKVHGAPIQRAAALKGASLFALIFGVGGVFQAAAASDRGGG